MTQKTNQFKKKRKNRPEEGNNKGNIISNRKWQYENAINSRYVATKDFFKFGISVLLKRPKRTTVAKITRNSLNF